MRDPISLITKNGITYGVDLDGIVFPIHDYNQPENPLPFFVGFKKDSPLFQRWAHSLSVLKNEFPEFYSQINRLETDTILTVNVVLNNGVIVDWTGMKPTRIADQTKNVLRIFDHYRPTGSPATMRFVTEDRIVINRNWKKIKEKNFGKA